MRQIGYHADMKRGFSGMVGQTTVWRRILAAIVAVSAAWCACNVAKAQTTKDFYAGRSINLIVPYDPGGYYDIGARLLARHLGRHIPGQPNVVVQNQPGMGGIGLANRFAVGADNEGLTLGVL